MGERVKWEAVLVRAAEIAELRGGLSQAKFATAMSDAYNQHNSDPLLQPIGHLRNWSLLLKDAKT